METGNIIEMGVGLVLFVYVVAAVAPGAINSIMVSNSTNYSFWGSSVLSLWGIMGIFSVVAIVLMIYGFVKGRL